MFAAADHFQRVDIYLRASAAVTRASAPRSAYAASPAIANERFIWRISIFIILRLAAADAAFRLLFALMPLWLRAAPRYAMSP